MVDPIRGSSHPIPNEILVRILQACIEPYTLQVHQRVYNATGIKAILRRKNLDLFNNDRDDEEDDQSNDTDEANVDQYGVGMSEEEGNDDAITNSTIIVHSFTIKGNEYLSGLPALVNLSRVNRSFHEEILSTIQSRFDGARAKGWRMGRSVSNLGQLPALKTRITEIAIEETNAGYLNCSILNFKQSPRLQKVTMRTGARSFLTNETDILNGSRDVIVTALFNNHIDQQNLKLMGVERLRSRNVRVIVEFTFGAGLVECSLEQPARQSDTNTFVSEFEFLSATRRIIRAHRHVNLDQYPLWARCQ